MFSRVPPASHITFEPNPHYHGGAPKLTSLVQKYVPDQQTLLCAVPDRRGRHLRHARASRRSCMPRPRRCRGQDLLSPVAVRRVHLLQLGKPQFADKGCARRCIGGRQEGLDRRGLLRRADPDAELSAAEHWAYNEDLKDPGFDLKGAAHAGRGRWTVGGDGVRAKDGVRLAFTMSTTAGNKSREQAQQLVQQNFKKINVEMTIKNMPASVVWGDYTVKASSTR